jgi:hypothetical protein
MYCLNLHTLAYYRRNDSGQRVLSTIYPMICSTGSTGGSHEEFPIGPDRNAVCFTVRG